MSKPGNTEPSTAMPIAELIRRMVVIVVIMTLAFWLAQRGQFFLYQGF